MADRRISELTTLVTPESNDYLAIVDSSTNENKKITAADLLKNGVSLIPNGGIPGTKVVPDFGGQTIKTTGAVEAGSAQVATINSGPLSGFRNAIINGSFDIAQRGLSGTSSQNYMLDRWISFHAGTAPTWAQVDGGVLIGTDACFRKALRVTGASGNTSTTIAQRIESFNCQGLVGKTVTLSAYVLQSTGSTRTVTLGISYPPSADLWTSATLIGQSVINVPSGTWTRVSWTTDLPLVGPDRGLQVQVQLGALGSGQQMFIVGVQLEPGPVATQFERRAIGVELTLCQRYYEAGVVGGATNNNATFSAGGIASAIFTFMTEKRVAPTMTARDSAGTSGTFNSFLNLEGTPGQVATGGALVAFARPGSWGTELSSSSSANRFSYKYEASAEL